VDGEICDPAPNPVTAGPPFAEFEAGPGISNGFPCPKPVADELDWLEEDAEEASAWMASMALDAAPIANNMSKLRYTPPEAAHTFTAIDQQTTCHGKKPDKITTFRTGDRRGSRQ
jgi:hypothetical protein